MFDLSLVLPAYNEADRLGAMLDDVARYQASGRRSLEVIVVDDGSTDATSALARSYADRISDLQVITLAVNAGKGAAVAAGMLAAQGRYRAFLDADGATPVGELDLLWSVGTRQPRTVAIGSVACRGARVERHQSATRRAAGRVANWLIRATVVPGIKDTQRGAKLFPAELADKVFAAQRATGWAFDVEVLALCRAAGYKVVEVPVRWRHVDGGQIQAGSYLATLRELRAIRRRVRAADTPSLARVAALATAVPAGPRAANGLAPIDHHAAR